MNSKECVARGCSLQAAMLSPIFQVRNFDVKDTYPFTVAISWEREDGPATSQLFGAVEKDGQRVPQHYPCVKSVTFMKTEPFTVTAAYTEDSPVPQVRAQTMAGTFVIVCLCCAHNINRFSLSCAT
jgi:heat shock 70kDa protein 4